MTTKHTQSDMGGDMSMPKHTPGPWAIHPEYSGHVMTVDGYAVAECDLDWSCIGRLARLANARLIAASPDLLAAQTMGAQLNTPDFLDWIADRLVHIHGESENVDFVLSLRQRASAGRAAIAKATKQL